jgi:Mn-dependent DtxR family transcriptional regulator
MIPIPALLRAVRDTDFERPDSATAAASLGCSPFEVRQAIDRATYQRLLTVKPDGRLILTSQGLAMVGRRRVVRVLP